LTLPWRAWTVSASEPLLSEAAYAVMARETFDPLKAFKSVMEGFTVHQGDRGEYLALLLLILAHDKAVGPPDENGHPQSQLRFFDFAFFLSKYLFRESATSATELGTL
jgi:hypothetical protein